MGDIYCTKYHRMDTPMPTEVNFAMFRALHGPWAGHFFALTDPYQRVRVNLEGPLASVAVTTDPSTAGSGLYEGEYRYKGQPSTIRWVRFNYGSCALGDMVRLVESDPRLPTMDWVGPPDHLIAKMNEVMNELVATSKSVIDSAILNLITTGVANPAIFLNSPMAPASQEGFATARRELAERSFFGAQPPITVPPDIAERLDHEFGKPRKS